MKGRLRHLILGGAATLALSLAVAYLSAAPGWQSLPADMALLRVSFTHSGDRSASCRERTPEELAELPPNMRIAKVCDRRRPPIYVEIEIDGATVLAEELPARGIAGSGPSRIYQRFPLPAGRHDIAVRLRDRPATQGFDYVGETQVTLVPAQSFVIDFRPESGGFVFK
ncbi:hypothetical protein [Pelagibius marinus]|uniref:hypothetical protein n=1 Tax=Pelagibius marinus TaxID=2762760 RepID=UPI0018729D5C|nr:hypothetical protein [Pelagibius marinus]